MVRGLWSVYKVMCFTPFHTPVSLPYSVSCCLNCSGWWWLYVAHGCFCVVLVHGWFWVMMAGCGTWTTSSPSPGVRDQNLRELPSIIEEIGQAVKVLDAGGNKLKEVSQAFGPNCGPAQLLLYVLLLCTALGVPGLGPIRCTALHCTAQQQ